MSHLGDARPALAVTARAPDVLHAATAAQLHPDMRHASLAPAALAFALAGMIGCSTIGGGTLPLGSGTANATLRNAAGATVGTATLTEATVGLLISGTVSGLPAGTHAIHVHAVGQCAPTFAAAGGHFNPTVRRHGFRSPDGHHAGDLPNLHVPAGGSLTFELTLAGVRLGGTDGLLDADGASLVIHAGADDYVTDPAGASGDRIACGVITGS